MGMTCPRCGGRPMSFRQFLSRLSAFRITCATCGSHLRAGPVVYIWTLLHIPLALGIVQLRRVLTAAGYIRSPLALLGYLVLALGVLFVTAWVIPWFLLGGVYRDAGSPEAASSSSSDSASPRSH